MIGETAGLQMAQASVPLVPGLGSAADVEIHQQVWNADPIAPVQLALDGSAGIRIFGCFIRFDSDTTESA